MNVRDIIELKKQLSPTGRAWKCPENGNFEKLFSGLSGEQIKCYDEVIGVLDSLYPDNENFSEEDCLRWESVLGISKSSSLDLRKSAILSKMSFPGTIKNRQNAKYLEYRLQQAGFDCFVYELKDIGLGGVIALSSNLDMSDDTELNGSDVIDFTGFIANKLSQSEEVEISYNALLKTTTFYITGVNQDYFNILDDSETEFRRIVMSVKPTHTVALLKGNFVSDSALLTMSGDNLYTLSGYKIVLV